VQWNSLPGLKLVNTEGKALGEEGRAQESTCR